MENRIFEKLRYPLLTVTIAIRRHLGMEKHILNCSEKNKDQLQEGKAHFLKLV